jgi:MFS family permease
MAADAAVAIPAASGRRATAWATLLLLAVTLMGGAAMRSLFSPVQEVVKLDLGLSDFQISLVQGLAASIPIALLSLPIGRLVDRSNRVRLLIAMTLVWTAGTFLTALAQSFALLFVARMLAGLGAISAVPIAISIAADLCSPDRRGRSLLLLSIGQNLGGAVAFALGGWLYGALAAAAPPFGLDAWRTVHIAFGVASALMILPLLALAEPARHEIADRPATAFAAAMRELWARRRFLGPLFVGQVGVVMADTASVIWAAPVLTRVHGLQPAEFAGWMGAIVLLPAIFGSLIGGFAADRGQHSPRRGGILLGAVAAAAVSIPAALFPILPTVEGFAALLTLLLLGGAIAGLVTATTIAVLVPNDIRGLCLGAFVVVGGIIGFGIAPTLVTLVGQLLGGESHLPEALAVTSVAIAVMSFLGFALAMRNAPPPGGTIS